MMQMTSVNECELCLFILPTFTPSPFPDDDTHMSVETSDQSQSWLELHKMY